MCQHPLPSRFQEIDREAVRGLSGAVGTGTPSGRHCSVSFSEQVTAALTA